MSVEDGGRLIVIQQFDIVRIILNRWIVQSSGYIQAKFNLVCM